MNEEGKLVFKVYSIIAIGILGTVLFIKQKKLSVALVPVFIYLCNS